MFSESSILASDRGHGIEGACGLPAGDGSLVAFYSLTGHTRTLAEQIREADGGRFEEVREPRRREGFPGEAGAVFDSLLRRTPSIRPPVFDPARFDRLLLGGPVWAGRIAAPLRTYARRYGARARSVSFFCTYDSDGAFDAMQELADLCGRRPATVLAVPAFALVSGSHEAAVQRFVTESLGSPRLAATPRGALAQPAGTAC